MITPKCLYLQEDFHKNSVLIQARFMKDLRNLKVLITKNHFMFAS